MHAKPGRKPKLRTGTPIQSLQTFLTELATIVRKTCRTSSPNDSQVFTVTTQSSLLERRLPPERSVGKCLARR